jgi:hypothetical protein
MIDPSISFLIALSFSALFATAGLQKLRAPAIFIATLAEYRLAPHALLWVAGAGVILLELAVALGLIWSTTRPTFAFVGAGLLVVYSGAIALNLIRGRRDIDCGCGTERRPIGRWMVWRNGLLAITVLTASLPVTGRTMGWIDIVTVSAGVLVAILLYAALDTLLGKVPSVEHP